MSDSHSMMSIDEQVQRAAESIMQTDGFKVIAYPHLLARIAGDTAEIKCLREQIKAAQATEAELAATTSAWAAAADERDQRNSELAAIRLYLGVPDSETLLEWVRVQR